MRSTGKGWPLSKQRACARAGALAGWRAWMHAHPHLPANRPAASCRMGPSSCSSSRRSSGRWPRPWGLCTRSMPCRLPVTSLAAHAGRVGLGGEGAPRSHELAAHGAHGGARMRRGGGRDTAEPRGSGPPAGRSARTRAVRVVVDVGHDQRALVKLLSIAKVRLPPLAAGEKGHGWRGRFGLGRQAGTAPPRAVPCTASCRCAALRHASYVPIYTRLATPATPLARLV